MSILDALRTRRSSAGVSERNNRLFIDRMSLQAIPPLGAGSLVVVQPFQNSIVKRPCQFTLVDIRVGIDENGCVRVSLPIVTEQRLIFLINNDQIDIRVAEDITYVLLFQPVIHRYHQAEIVSQSQAILLPSDRIPRANSPTLTPEAAAMPKIDSKKAGVLGHRIPTRLCPCFLR